MSLPDDEVDEVVDAEIVDDGPSADVVDPAARHHDIEDAEVVDDASSPAESLTFPRLHARTQRFTLGEPRTVEVNATGTRILFLRSRHGQDPINCLWVVDAASGEERLLADPAMLIADDSTALPADELARRERTREAAGGITSYAIDRDGTVAAFGLAGRLFFCDVDSGVASELPVGSPVFDPRPDPDGQRVAYVSERTLCVAELDGSWRVIAGGDGEPETVTWGSADFIAAEEMRRHRGYWWSPDGSTIAATRVDAAPISAAWIADPAQPTTPPRRVAYPFAGTDNAEVSLHLIGLDGDIVDIDWDRNVFPYLTEVHWSAAGMVISTQSRSQQSLEILDVDVATGATDVRFADDDDRWVELVAGAPRLWTGGELVNCADREGARRLLIDGEPVTPADLQVRSVVAVDQGGVVFIANPIDDATVSHVWRYDENGLAALTDEPGVHTAAAAGGTVVIRTATLDEPLASWDTLDGIELASAAATPNLALNASVHFFGSRQLATTVLLPNGHDGTPLPVLLDPYGGPHALRSVRAYLPHLVSQWFADHGFAVVVVDGRGTPGRGSEWERAIHGDLASPTLEDQIDALEQAAAELGCLDLDRVAIRGWSFGGYLAALAVLLRPDRVHAAVAGAPVTEWRLYDTHYTERYLGDPTAQPEVYDGSSLLPIAGALSRPLLLIHGLADDNVLAAHTLELSSRLLGTGRPHEVLPLVGVTHMTPQEVVAENLLLHQLDFLRRSLGT
jgi:dipeptidyl-peptidase-4